MAGREGWEWQGEGGKEMFWGVGRAEKGLAQGWAGPGMGGRGRIWHLCRILTPVGLLGLARPAQSCTNDFTNATLGSPIRAAKAWTKVRGKYPFTLRQLPAASYTLLNPAQAYWPASSSAV